MASPSRVAPIASANSLAVRLMFCLTKIVHGRVANRPRVPSAMNPNPVLRVFPNYVLENLRKLLGIFEDIAFLISRSNQFHGRLKTEPVFIEFLVPDGVAGHNCSIRVQR